MIKTSLKVMGKTYTSKGNTVEKALSSLKTPFAKGMGILTLEKGDLKRDKVLNMKMVNGVFGQANPAMKELAMRNIISLFEDFDK